MQRRSCHVSPDGIKQQRSFLLSCTAELEMYAPYRGSGKEHCFEALGAVDETGLILRRVALAPAACHLWPFQE